mmetsp:Transcript_40997/g.112762  ORF Transcript_40997/g.112762 Transcript_40997/m.112762 type:complete len:516 (+) Transcript_40997:135-1682(+)
MAADVRQTVIALFWVMATVILGRGEEVAPAPMFIEDAFQAAVRPTVHMLFGVNAAGMLLSKDVQKTVWQELAPFSFQQQVAESQRHGPGAAAAACESGVENGHCLTNLARIFVHNVPRCAGEELLEHFMAQGEGFGWNRAMQLHATHAAAVHRAILSSGAVVQSAENATVFYIPAFFGLLVERWLDTRDPGALNCIARAWGELPDELFLRNGGYDHFLVAGTCHPFSVCGTMECDVTTYHPFAGNVMVLSGGVREFGHPDDVFHPARAYSQLRHIFVPFPVTLDCARLEALSAVSHPRPVSVSFVGSENSRVRRHFRDAVEGNQWPLELFVRVLPDDEDSAGARQAALGGGGTSVLAGNAYGLSSLAELYAASQLCLMLPGHIYDFGRRAYDFMAQGCVPVVVSEAPLAVALPFPGQLPWEDIAIFVHVESGNDAARVLTALLDAAGTEEGLARIARRRKLLSQLAPRLYLPPHVRCPDGAGSAVDGIVQELGVRVAAWTSFRAVRPVTPGVVSI